MKYKQLQNALFYLILQIMLFIHINNAMKMNLALFSNHLHYAARSKNIS